MGFLWDFVSGVRTILTVVRRPTNSIFYKRIKQFPHFQVQQFRSLIESKQPHPFDKSFDEIVLSIQSF
jgi:hypothetical protein